MSRTAVGNALDDGLIKEIVRRIVAVADPEKVILFGSYARGDQHEYSDVDIMVIKESSLPRYRRGAPIRLALADLPVDKDIIVFTPQEEQEWAAASTSLVATALREEGRRPGLTRAFWDGLNQWRAYPITRCRSATMRSSGPSAPMWKRLWRRRRPFVRLSWKGCPVWTIIRARVPGSPSFGLSCHVLWVLPPR